MPTNSLSVLDPCREELRHNAYARGSYTYSPKIPKVKFSLGWELEANHGAVRSPAGVQIHSDGSVNGDSMEYVVMPTLVKSVTYVLGLLKDLVHAPELNTDKSCGFHVHVAPMGIKVPVMRRWAIIAQSLAKAIEAEAFAAVPDARQSNQYCRKIVLLNGMRFSASKYSNDSRYNWLNIVEMFRPAGIRTIEVRLLGNTHRWKYLAAWSLFSLELGRQAWRVLHNPLAHDSAVQSLQYLLSRIKDEIKPLEKRGEPVPQWVYDGLKSLGVDYSKWDRPLAELVAKECDALGIRKRFYSDNQATIETQNDDQDLCWHDVDRENDVCGDCDHADGNCESRYCGLCRMSAHRNGDLCEYENCLRCDAQRAETAAENSNGEVI